MSSISHILLYIQTLFFALIRVARCSLCAFFFVPFVSKSSAIFNPYLHIFMTSALWWNHSSSRLFFYGGSHKSRAAITASMTPKNHWSHCSSSTCNKFAHSVKSSLCKCCCIKKKKTWVRLSSSQQVWNSYRLIDFSTCFLFFLKKHFILYDKEEKITS